MTFYRGRSPIEPARSRPRRGAGFLEVWLRGRYVGVAW